MVQNYKVSKDNNYLYEYRHLFVAFSSDFISFCFYFIIKFVYMKQKYFTHPIVLSYHEILADLSSPSRKIMNTACNTNLKTYRKK